MLPMTLMKRKILVISPTPTHPQVAGNRARIDGLISSMRTIGHDVFFLHIKNEEGDARLMRDIWGDNFLSVEYTKPESKTARIKRRLKGFFNPDARYTYTIDEWYDNSLDTKLAELSSKIKFDTVIVEYVFFSKALECFGNHVLKIIDTHDAFANRHRHYLEKGQFPKWYSTSASEETKGFDRADIVIAIQDKEREMFARQTRAHVITVGHIVPLHKAPENASHSGQMLFVASDNAINVDGINYFIEKIFPGIRQKVPEAELVLAGSICNAIEDQTGIVKLGRVDDLQPVYDSAAMVINPVLFNTGLSIKNLEALGYSKPLVTAPVGADGIEDGAGEAFVVAENADEFTAAVIKILTDGENARQLAAAAGRYAKKWNHCVIQQLEGVLG